MVGWHHRLKEHEFELPEMEGDRAAWRARASPNRGVAGPRSPWGGNLLPPAAAGTLGLWLHRPVSASAVTWPLLLLCALWVSLTRTFINGVRPSSSPTSQSPAWGGSLPRALYQTHPFGPARGQVPPGRVS